MSLLSDYINKGTSAADLEKELLGLINEYNVYKKTFLIVVSSSLEKQIPNINLSMDDYYIIFDFRKLPCGRDHRALESKLYQF